MSLWSLFLAHRGRTIHKWKHYFPAYETHFARFINQPLTFIEIGCGEGGSLQLWKSYFGPHAQIVGLDIRPECAAYAEDQIDIRIGSQADPTFLHQILAEYGNPTIVLDDGSHIMTDITTSFTTLYPHLTPTGIYMVEDLHTAYWTEYGGGLNHPNSFIEYAKSLIDDLNADWSRNERPPSDFTKTTTSIHFYDSLAVFQRGQTLAKNAPRYGGV